MNTTPTRKDFKNASPAKIEEELLKLNIFERFEGDVDWLATCYAPDLTPQEAENLRMALARANPLRSAAIAPASLLDDLVLRNQPEVDVFQHCAEVIKAADAILITAGAGMGVDSGLPDFRGNEGFWKAYPALAESGLRFTDVATPETFETDPALAWGFYGHRLNLYRKTVPHAGFTLLQDFARSKPHGAFIYTSNVDGQFQKAGFAANQVIECHGSIHHLQCLRRCRNAIWPADAFIPEVDTARCRLLNAPPRCPHCGDLARPNILMFNDSDWLDGRLRAQEALFDEWRADIRRLVVIETGAGTAIPSARHFSEYHNAFIIRINPRESALPKRCRGISLPMSGMAALQAIQSAFIDSA